MAYFLNDRRRSQTIRLFGCFLIFGAMAVLLLAAIGKLLDMPAFIADLHTWSLLPARLVLLIGLIIPIVELTIATAWLLGVMRRVSVISAIALLSVFTSAYFAHIIFAQPPNCNCFLAIRKFQHNDSMAYVTIVRNFGLIFMLFVGNRLVAKSLPLMER